jgi:flagellin
LAVADENVSAARSRIQDLDFAQGVSESVAANVQSQAAIAIQSQANQQQSSVLSLLS